MADSPFLSLVRAAQDGGLNGIQMLPGMERGASVPGTVPASPQPGLGSLAPGLPAGVPPAPAQNGNADLTNLIMEMLGQARQPGLPSPPKSPSVAFPEARPGLGSMAELPGGEPTMAGSGIPSEPSFLPSVIPGSMRPSERNRISDTVAGNAFAPEAPSMLRPSTILSPGQAAEPPSRYQLRARREPMSAMPTAPELQAIPEFDGDMRGQEKAALTALIAGTIFGGGNAGLRAALGAAQGHAAGRGQVFQREASQAQATNKNALDSYRAQGDQWTAGERAKDNAYAAMIRDDANAINQEKGFTQADVAKQRIEAQLKQTDAKLHTDILKFNAETARKQQETAGKFLEWAYENGGTMDLGSQGLLIDRYNRMATSAGLDPLPVPGTIYTGADGVPRMVPGLGKSPKALTSEANTRLSGAQVGNIQSQISDRSADNIRAEKQQTFMQNHLRTLEGFQGRRIALAEEHKTWRESSKAVDQMIAQMKTASKAEAKTGAPTAQQAAAIQKELALSGNAILNIRKNAGEMPDPSDLDYSDEKLAQWKERRDDVEVTARALREYLNGQAARIGYSFDGVGYVPKAPEKSAQTRAIESYAPDTSRRPDGSLAAPVVNLPRPTPLPVAPAPVRPVATPRPTPTPRPTGKAPKLWRGSPITTERINEMNKKELSDFLKSGLGGE